MTFEKRKTRVVTVGDVEVGGNAPVSVQTMTNSDTSDVGATVAQIKKVSSVGCDIVRVSVPDMKSAKALRKIKDSINIPLVADIHFDYRLALESIRQGVDKLRINPGNIGSSSDLNKVVDAAKRRSVPIRIGVNMGSLDKNILNKYGRTSQAMVVSALRHIELLEERNFFDIIVSLKASDVERTVTAYQELASKVNYPLHLGVTETGTIFAGTIKSSIGIGALLVQGIGDTIRVSLTGSLTEEIRVGCSILKALGLRKSGVEVISCPTCARASINVEKLAMQVEAALKNYEKPIKIAVMGCVVNGPGEAIEADVGVTGSKKGFVVFKKGKVCKRVNGKNALKALLDEIEQLL